MEQNNFERTIGKIRRENEPMEVEMEAISKCMYYEFETQLHIGVI